ncbi:ABC transporter ATP-binding protein [Streptomyces sp. TRM 70361]|uniref:ABC transporter ATP-binding protein n=1 Tax=Streptomyces sp. TRM 70361 TaxID=3116553 RepID=UPI002E7AE8FA|nr:ABC transporter ATP-binding protein [Streptomyces sp. TRM 70361]MEE1940380.1 ABC transporter ATP-binding protein [Streptomyces sp. TRM 70361]
MTPVALTEGLSKSYGKHKALDGLSLSINQGEVFGYLGPNGAGKTTTIRLLLDLIRPTSGRIEVFGKSPREGGSELRRRIGYLPGELPLAGRGSGLELLEFLARVRGGVQKATILSLAERLNVDLKRPVHNLSKGNKQKVGIIQAFMHQPDLLILDEPTTGLDPLVQQEFLTMVREAKQNGQTVLMSSHILSEVQHVGDRVAIIRGGKLISVSDVDTLLEQAQRRVEIRFADPVDPRHFSALSGVRDVKVQANTLSCTLDGAADALVKVAARHTVVSLVCEEPDLEEIFLHAYAQESEEEMHGVR